MIFRGYVSFREGKHWLGMLQLSTSAFVRSCFLFNSYTDPRRYNQDLVWMLDGIPSWRCQPAFSQISPGSGYFACKPSVEMKKLEPWHGRHDRHIIYKWATKNDQNHRQDMFPFVDLGLGETFTWFSEMIANLHVEITICFQKPKLRPTQKTNHLSSYLED